MSDSERDASVLGKRSRNGEEAENGKMDTVEDHQEPMDADDDDDDDVGPMPMPAGAGGQVAKKKRKGELRSTSNHTGEKAQHIMHGVLNQPSAPP